MITFHRPDTVAYARYELDLAHRAEHFGQRLTGLPMITLAGLDGEANAYACYYPLELQYSHRIHVAFIAPGSIAADLHIVKTRVMEWIHALAKRKVQVADLYTAIQGTSMYDDSPSRDLQHYFRGTIAQHVQIPAFQYRDWVGGRTVHLTDRTSTRPSETMQRLIDEESGPLLATFSSLAERVLLRAYEVDPRLPDTIKDVVSQQADLDSEQVELLGDYYGNR
jgi:hypothetical protein